MNAVLITFAAAIDLLARQSITRAIMEEQRQSKDETGITIMTDARHACRKNSYHSDHVALGMKTHKVVKHPNNNEERRKKARKKHEAYGCSRMYEEFEKMKVKVSVHVHDRNTSINKTVKTMNGVQNCNERWHASRPVTKCLKKIGAGPKKHMGKTWHPQLADKGSLVRNHMYWAMDKCNADATRLRQLIASCVPHFQNIHTTCHEDSHCREKDYVPNYTIVTDPVAVTMLTKFLKYLTLYKNAEDYVLSLDTYYVESYNNTCLIYLDKRIHYKETMYKLRSQLTVLDWNEHVDRAFTSIYYKLSGAHIRRHQGKKQYKKKSYLFVQELWELLMATLGKEDESTSRSDHDNDNDDSDSDDDYDDDSDDDGDN